MLLFDIAPNHVAGQRIPVWSDNTTTVAAIAKWRSKRDPTINQMLKRLVLRARDLDIELSQIEESHFPGRAMPADPISRKDGLPKFIASLRTDGHTLPRIRQIPVPPSLRMTLTQALHTS